MGSSSCAVSASVEEGVAGDSESAVLSSVGYLDGSGAGVSDDPRSSINRAFWRSSMRAARSEARTFEPPVL